MLLDVEPSTDSSGKLSSSLLKLWFSDVCLFFCFIFYSVDDTDSDGGALGLDEEDVRCEYFVFALPYVFLDINFCCD